MAARRIPGLSLAVVVRGEVVRTGGYGVANLELAAPATDSTAYLIASITKTFTAVATMMLVEEGRVALDDPISRHVPDLPEPWRPATVRQLLDHTSGINSLTEHERPPCGASKLGRDYTQADVLAEVACLPLDFPPGTAWSYSDTGYFLLGLLIERVAGQTYEGFLRERVFAPLGMDHTRLLSQADLIANRADGYVWADGAYRNGPALSPVVEFSFGGLVSTVGDLARYDIALSSGRLLRAETREAMWTPTPVGEAHYGLGFALRPLNGRRHVGHTGGGPAAATIYARFPDDDVAVIVLTNAGQPPSTIRELAGGVASFFFEE